VVARALCSRQRNLEGVSAERLAAAGPRRLLQPAIALCTQTGQHVETVWLHSYCASGIGGFSSYRSASDVYTFNRRSAVEASFVTAPFSIQGEDENIEIEIATDLDNAWAYFDLALINVDDGHAYLAGREVSYYHGHDSDGNWSEGKAHNSVTLSSIPAGRYYLRVEPQMDNNANTPVMNYTVTVRRGVIIWSYFFFAAIFLGIPPLLATWRRYSFERSRWQESDYSGFPGLKANA
jgi:hypothetical protein